MMKVIQSLKSGFFRSSVTWKGALICWFVFLICALIVAFPMKEVMKAGFGHSMIVERLKYGFDIEAFTDPGTAFKSLVSFLKGGLMFLIPVSLVLNAFFTGGFFASVKSLTGKFSMAEFWKNSSKNFWSFFCISFIVNMMIFFLLLFVIIIPLLIISGLENHSEILLWKIGLTASAFFILLLPLLILVADYARAWQVANEKSNCFAALGFGFSRTFRKLASSWILVFVIMLVQAIYLWFVFILFHGIHPTTGRGILLYFLLLQLLVILKIMLKVFRYGSVTALMEQT